jgi:uncharacterized protein (TIGR00159 family)
MDFLSLVTTLRIRDIADILLLGMLVYHLYLWFRGTKAFKALVGLVAMGLVFTIARTWGLFLTTWVFQILWQVLVILLIILFQSEIREVLERVNPMRVLGLRKRPPLDWTHGFCAGVFALATRRIGALLILERTDRVNEWTTACQALEAEAAPEVMLAVFHKDSPLHDGAVLIREGKIRKAACYLPLSSSEGLPKDWGTRHRAALGLSERCDAWVVAVSEERGKVTLAREGKAQEIRDREALAALIAEGLDPLSVKTINWGDRLKSYLTFNWAPKLISLGIVSVSWLMLAGQQDFEVSFLVEPVLRNIPEDKEIVEPINPRVDLTVRGLRRDASTLRAGDVRVEMDLSLAQVGYRVFSVSRDQVILPNDRIQVVQIRPAQMEFRFRDRH